MIKFLLTFFAATFITASCSGNNPGHDTDDPSPITGRYGADMSFDSKVLKRPMFYSIYLPKDYDTAKEKSYPVVYLLHGLTDSNKSWNDKWLDVNNLINELEADGLGDMIYVFPYGFNHYWCNHYNGKYDLMDMIINEFIPLIDSTYRTIPDRQHRCVTGYSMGGFGAVALAEKHPETFCCSAALSMSFRTDSQYMTEMPQSGWDNQWGSIFGGVGMQGEARLTDYYKQHCPLYQFVPENKEKFSAVKWFFTCGDNEDQLLIAGDLLHVQMRDYGIEHEYRVGEGGHDGTYWRKALREVLPMFCFYMNGGEKWQGEISVPQVSRAEFAADGTLASDSFVQTGRGAGIYFVYSSSEKEEQMKDIMSLFHAYASSGTSFICLPCDLSVKDFDSWRSEYSAKLTFTSERAFAIGTSCAAVTGKGLKSLNFVEASIPDNFVPEYGTSYHFACTDNSNSYKSMNTLYTRCKEGNVAFEYRVIKGTEDRDGDILRCVNELKSYFMK